MQTIDLNDDEKYILRIGDIIDDLYVPVVQAGRYKCNVKDIEELLDMWMNHKERYLTEDKRENEEDSFTELKEFALVFKETLFSLILSKSKYENELIAWEILWCAWTDVFKRSFEENNIYVQKYSMKRIIDFQIGSIYLLFVLYFSQYVEEHQHPFAIYMTPNTLNLCLDVSEHCEEKHKYFELRGILNFMMDTNSIILSCYDRVSELFQDRYGNPINVPKRNFLEKDKFEFMDINMEQCTDSFLNEINNALEPFKERRTQNQMVSTKNTFIDQMNYHIDEIKKILNDDFFLNEY